MTRLKYIGYSGGKNNILITDKFYEKYKDILISTTRYSDHFFKIDDNWYFIEDRPDGNEESQFRKEFHKELDLLKNIGGIR